MLVLSDFFGKQRQKKGGEIHEHNTFEKPDEVKTVEFKDYDFKGDTLKIKIPASSVLHLEVTI